MVALLSLIGFDARAENVLDNVYGISFKTPDDKPLPLSQYRGKVLLIVNTASRCGFTPQYAGLQKLYETYRDKGLVILGVPSNDFGAQEPGDAAQIKEFTERSFHITFPLTAKEVITGDNAHPFYKAVRARFGLFAKPRWNFYKYLVSSDGHLVSWYTSATVPQSPKLVKAIEAELNKGGE